MALVRVIELIWGLDRGRKKDQTLSVEHQSADGIYTIQEGEWR